MFKINVINVKSVEITNKTKIVVSIIGFTEYNVIEEWGFTPPISYFLLLLKKTANRMQVWTKTTTFVTICKMMFQNIRSCN